MAVDLPVAVLNMGVHAVVTLIAAGLAIAVIAMYLIKIIFILWVVINRLVEILDAVVAVTDRSRPVGSVIDDINADLDAGRRALEQAVGTLEERRVPAEPEPAVAASPSWEHWGR